MPKLGKYNIMVFSGRDCYMRKISALSLEPGMKLGQSIYGAGGEVLLNAGTILTRNYIKNIIRYGILDTYVDDGLLPDIIMDEMLSRETRLAAVHQIKRIMIDTREKGELVINPQPLYNTVNNIVGELLSSEKILYNLIDLRTQDDYTYEHSVNVCVLSLMTGITLGYQKDDLIKLGIGAILHDLGKVMIPLRILNKPGKLSDEEYSIIMEHAGYGYRMIKSLGQLGEIPAIIAYQHHENYDGSGYPNGISGDEFNEFAQIASISDRFDALTANRSYRHAFPSHEAFEMCLGSGNLFFNNIVVNSFLYNVAAYPTGTLVELNNHMIAAVTETPKGYSLFPKVRVLLGEGWQPIKSQPEIALNERQEYSIVRVFNNIETRSIMETLKRSNQ